MPWLWPVLLAPFAGSLVGVLIRRLPRGEPVGMTRSRCESCGGALAARDLVPVLSYVALRGRCRRCGAPIAPFHWRVELAALLVPVSAAAAGVVDEAAWAVCGAGWTLLALAWIDADWMLLPDVLTLPLLLAGLAATWWLDPGALPERAVAAGLGWAGLWAVGAAYRQFRGRDGLGEGDGKLLGALGAWVGLAGLADVLLGAAVAGLAWAGLLALRGRRIGATTALPFGPFLALAGWAALLAAWR